MGSLRIWDVILARQIDAIQVDVPITALSLSPNMDILATNHVDKNGVYLWQEASGALWNLSFDDRNREAIAAAGGVQALERAAGASANLAPQPAVPTGVPNTNPLNLFPQGIPNLGANENVGDLVCEAVNSSKIWEYSIEIMCWKCSSYAIKSRILQPTICWITKTILVIT
ncbi:protein ARABIDILLO [Trifolium repens]|nr:protein ARABIDILLO [Trifolium repens]